MYLECISDHKKWLSCINPFNDFSLPLGKNPGSWAWPSCPSVPRTLAASPDPSLASLSPASYCSVTDLSATSPPNPPPYKVPSPPAISPQQFLCRVSEAVSWTSSSELHFDSRTAPRPQLGFSVQVTIMVPARPGSFCQLANSVVLRRILSTGTQQMEEIYPNGTYILVERAV